MKGEQLKTTVNALFQVIRERSTSQEIVFICVEKSCGDTTGNRSASLVNGKTSCWRCGKGGDFVRWARRLGYIVGDEQVQSAPVDEIDLSCDLPGKDPLPPVLDIKLPDGFIPCSARPNSVYTQLIGEMAVAKRLTLDDFLEVGVGYTRRDPRWEPYAIFPVTEHGRNVYYQGRLYHAEPGVKTKKFPSRTEVKYGAKYWLYGLDEVKRLKPNTVIIVEAILNVLSLRRYLRFINVTDVVPVAVFQHSISQAQVQKLLAHTCVEELCLLWDHDASQRSWDKSPFLCNKARLSIAEMPLGAGGEKTDPNDDVEAAWRAFEDRTPFQPDRATLRSAATLGNPIQHAVTPADDKRFDILGMADQLLNSVEHNDQRSKA